MHRWIMRVVLVGSVLAIGGGQSAGLRAQGRDVYKAARQKLVAEAVMGAGVTARRVVEAMRNTPRHEFVPTHLRKMAYYDMALPIGDQQTISSPFIVAFMTQSLQTKATDKVLEIGTGSGYQAAVLSPLVKHVYSIEIVPSLGRRAERALRRLKYQNVHVKVGDGFKGWPEHAPFDKIIVTCSPEKIPTPLAEQLREGGLMVVPVGERYQQTLYLLRKKNGKLESEALRPTLFVPMTGAAEDARQVKPDPRRPQVRNGTFEERPKAKQFQPGWYYQRQLEWMEDPDAPEGAHYIRFRNSEAGRAAHLLQGFAVDGQYVKSLELSCSVRHDNVQAGRTRDESAMVAVTFYDGNRRDLGIQWLGPFRGTQPWHRVRKIVQVPARAREGILRVGLFGATGELSVDNVQFEIKSTR